MGSETQDTQNDKDEKQQSTLTFLAMIGGLGIAAIMLALGLGVLDPNVDSGLIGLVVLAGFGLLIFAVGGWVMIVQPHRNYDDITVPQYTGHHDDEH